MIGYNIYIYNNTSNDRLQLIEFYESELGQMIYSWRGISEISPLPPPSPLLLILTKEDRFELLLVEVLQLDISTTS
jgi:hypothetical protein